MLHRWKVYHEIALLLIGTNVIAMIPMPMQRQAEQHLWPLHNSVASQGLLYHEIAVFPSMNDTYAHAALLERLIMRSRGSHLGTNVISAIPTSTAIA